VLHDGRVLDDMTALRQGQTPGDNLAHVIGGEGTLGPHPAEVLTLFAKPRALETAFVAVRRPRSPIVGSPGHRRQRRTTVVAFE